MNTAWMIRNDGTAFPCVCHTYGDPNIQGIEETLAAAQWLYEHTTKDATRTLCMELIYNWATQFSAEGADIVQGINKAIDSRPYHFLSKEFIASHIEELHSSCWERSLADMNEEVTMELNQEFLRARYGGLYDTAPDSQEMFFRISSVGFDWYPIIRDFVEKSALPIQSVTIVRDAESTGGGNQPYRTINGKGVYNRLPLCDFLAERGDLIAQDKHLTTAVPAEPITKRIVEGLATGRSLWELHDLPINFERLKQKVKRHSQQELKLTREGSDLNRPQ